MVNSLVKRGKKIPLFLFYFIFSYRFSQDLTKYYTARVQENGILYFIEPKNVFKSNENKFFYNLTYLNSNDTIALKFFFIAKSPWKIDSFCFILPTYRICDKPYKLYIDFDGKNWIHRYEAHFEFDSLEKIYQFDAPPLILLRSENQTTSLKISSRKWKREASTLKKIYYIIRINK
ncbi:MAG: hypothetical protein N2662_05265 [Bacteroidales bacterium]|nr:hypothetical protein [Bacteroidales bacterium]